MPEFRPNPAVKTAKLIRIWRNSGRVTRSAQTTSPAHNAGQASGLRCVAIVIPQQAAEPFAALDVAIVPTDRTVRIDDLVAQRLMIALLSFQKTSSEGDELG